MLVSTCKMEKGHVWHSDRAFAERNAVEDESAEETMSEEEEPVRTRPKRIPGGGGKPSYSGDGPSEFENSMAASADARQMLLGDIVAGMR